MAKSGLLAVGRRALARVLDASGATGIAKSVMTVHDETLHRLTTMALERGVSERAIKRALRAYDKWQQFQALASIAFPGIPSTVVLRAVAEGKVPHLESAASNEQVALAKNGKKRRTGSP